MQANCKLCGLFAELRLSHIMPDFYIRSSEAQLKTGSQNQTQPHSFVVGVSPDFKDGWKQRNNWEKQLGWTEYLLCHDCEQRFGVHEAAARDFFYGNAPAPLKKQPLGTIVQTPQTGSPPGFLEIREVAIDYRELKLFQMSLLWRAGVAKGSFFKNVNLGEKHEKRLKLLLASDDPGLELDYPCIMFDLRSQKIEFEGFWREPTDCHDEDQGQKLYKIVIGGYAFMYSVSSHPPSPQFDLFCAKANGKMFLYVVNGELFLKRMYDALGKAGKWNHETFAFKT
jgi:hypothetical protein